MKHNNISIEEGHIATVSHFGEILKGKVIFAGFTLVTGRDSVMIELPSGDPSRPFTANEIVSIEPGHNKPIQLSLF